MPDDVELAQLGQGGGNSPPDAPAGIRSSSGRSGTSGPGQDRRAPPGRLVSKSRGGGSSLYMVSC